MGFLGEADLSLLYRFDSGTTHSFASTGQQLTAIQRQLGSAYASLPSSQTIFYEDRGTGNFDGSHIVDFGFYYNVPVFRTVRPYVKVDVFNVFNDDTLIGHNFTVLPDPNSPRDALGLATGYIRGSNFGNALSNASHPRARAFQVSVGVRF
jgi:hypothetical protein